ncbi:Uncharacterised protein [Halioglobus japonicus]|nr:Uncharacterised protein [Halioglobus japonicus]
MMSKKIIKFLLRKLALCLVMLVGMSQLASAATGAIPTQFIAKQYTELLGRAPTPIEWNSAVAVYDLPSGCSRTALLGLTSSIANSSEFNSLYNSSTKLGRAARFTALVRATLNHDPNTNDWSSYFVPYDSGSKSWTQTVNAVMGIYFVAFLEPSICSETESDYGFFYSSPLDMLDLTSGVPSRTQAQLQAALNAAGSGGVVELEPGEVVRIGGVANGNQGLSIPAGVTLTTRTAPDREQYATMGRIVPVADAYVCIFYFCSNFGLVRVEEGATLTRVWVDGQGTKDDIATRVAVVETVSSTAANPTSVRHVRISNPGRDGAGLRGLGYSITGLECTDLELSDNLITAYSASHNISRLTKKLWADGIVIECEDATVADNDVVDASNRGITLQGSWNSTVNQRRTQQSSVTGNVVLSAGSSAHVAIGADPTGRCMAEGGFPPVDCIEFSDDRLDGLGGTFEHERSYVGAIIDGNTFWTGSRTHFDIGLMAGSKAVWGGNGPLAHGLELTNNTTGSATARVHSGVVVAGMEDTDLKGNASNLLDADQNTAVAGLKCDTGDVLIDPSTSSLTVGSQAATDSTMMHCFAHHPPKGGLERLVVSGTQLVGAVSGQPFQAYGQQVTPLSDDLYATDLREDEFVRNLIQMGSNAVRVNLQYKDYFKTNSCVIDNAALLELDDMIRRIQEHGIYVFITGLGSYAGDPADPQDCYVNVTDQDRWDEQANFWSVIAGRLDGVDEVIALSLINEPLALSDAADCWTGPGTGPGCQESAELGFFNANIGREGNVDHEAWLSQMVYAIKSEDNDRLVTMGCLTFVNCGGFGIEALHEHLDFLSVHIYTRNCLAGPSLICSNFHVSGDNATNDPLGYEKVVLAAYTAAPTPPLLQKPVMITETGGWLTSPVDDQPFISYTDSLVAGWFGNWGNTTISEIYTDPDSLVIQVGIGPWGKTFQGMSTRVAP